jgi:hypothetical protein
VWALVASNCVRPRLDLTSPTRALTGPLPVGPVPQALACTPCLAGSPCQSFFSQQKAPRSSQRHPQNLGSALQTRSRACSLVTIKSWAPLPTSSPWPKTRLRWEQGTVCRGCTVGGGNHHGTSPASTIGARDLVGKLHRVTWGRTVPSSKG